MFTKYRCTHGDLTLMVRTTDAPDRMRVMVTKKPADPFRQALVIPPGTVLRLQRGKHTTVFVRVRVFCPRINYGHIVAGGEVVVDESTMTTSSIAKTIPGRV